MAKGYLYDNGDELISREEVDSLPEVSSTDNGKVLTVKSGKWEADTPASGLPSSTSEDEGKVLTVNASGGAEWATPSGGGVLKVNMSASTVTLDIGGQEYEGYPLDKTYAEITSADYSYLLDSGSLNPITFYGTSGMGLTGYDYVCSFATDPDYPYTCFAETSTSTMYYIDISNQ